MRKKEKPVSELLKKMDDRVEHLGKLDKIREERKELNASCLREKMKVKKNNNGKTTQKN